MVCVIGAGVAGTCAAIQAARSGEKCLLIENRVAGTYNDMKLKAQFGACI